MGVSPSIRNVTHTPLRFSVEPGYAETIVARAESPLPLKFAQAPTTKPEYFVSYAWGDPTPEGQQREIVVDQLCAAAQERGITILWSQRDNGRLLRTRHSSRRCHRSGSPSPRTERRRFWLHFVSCWVPFNRHRQFCTRGSIPPVAACTVRFVARFAAHIAHFAGLAASAFDQTSGQTIDLRAPYGSLPA
jgi:hypothetical protein